MSTGVAVRIDTGEKVADGENFEIGSGDSSGITQFTVTDLVVTAIDPSIPVKNHPTIWSGCRKYIRRANSTKQSRIYVLPNWKNRRERKRSWFIWWNGFHPANMNNSCD